MTDSGPKDEPCPTCGGTECAMGPEDHTCHLEVHRDGLICRCPCRPCPDCGGEGTMTAFRERQEAGP